MITKYKQTIIGIIHQRFPNCKIYIFGSRSRKTNREGADIDIALDCGKKISLFDLLTIKDEIEETTLPVFVDIIDIQSVSDDFKKEISKDMILWT